MSLNYRRHYNNMWSAMEFYHFQHEGYTIDSVGASVSEAWMNKKVPV